MTAANAHRGEITIRLDADYVIRPDFEAAAAIDEQLGSIIDVARRALSEKSLSYREASIIICEGMKAQGRAKDDKTMQAVNLRRVQQLVYEAGMLTVLGPCLGFLAAAVTGGADAGNAPAADEKA